MSVTMVEKVLYDLSVDRSAKQAFRDDATALLAGYRLGEDEIASIRSFDLHDLSARGVNPMLLMGFWRLSGEDMPSYLRRIAEPLPHDSTSPTGAHSVSAAPDR
jgi:hypothetical protein